jgi:hypothetical protein
MSGEYHRDTFKKIDTGNGFFSVILIQEPLDESMMENPKYVRKIPITHTSRIEQEARSLMDSDYHGNYDWIKKEIENIIRKLNIKINIRSSIITSNA